MSCKRYSYKWPGLAKFTEALASLNNNPTATAKHFGVSKSTIYEWIKLNNLQHSEDTQPAAQPQTEVALVCFNRSDVRTQIVSEEIWFNLSDVCRVIDYQNVNNALRLIESDDFQKLEVTDSMGRPHAVTFISEPGLYQFLLSSSVPLAKPFKRWITKEVIPAIRKTGSYSMAPAAPANNSLPQWAEMLMQQMGGTVIEVRQQQAAQQQQIEQMQQTVAAMPTVAADEVLARLQAVDSLKTHLHDLVDAIVTRAREYPPSDAYAWQYSHYQRAWKAVHEWAVPKVKSKAEYRTTAQVLAAIRGAEMILSKMGVEAPPQPQQLTINLFDHHAAG